MSWEYGALAAEVHDLGKPIGRSFGDVEYYTGLLAKGQRTGIRQLTPVFIPPAPPVPNARFRRAPSPPGRSGPPRDIGGCLRSGREPGSIH